MKIERAKFIKRKRKSVKAASFIECSNCRLSFKFVDRIPEQAGAEQLYLTWLGVVI
jgi:hypothetical protein